MSSVLSKRPGRALGLLALAGLVLAGCGSETTDVESGGPPLVVYSAYADVDYLPALFKDFTDETGISVVVRHRSDEANLQDMRMKSGGAPADVLLSASLGTIWTAADEGLLRPFSRESAARNLPTHLRDPDDLWVAVSMDPIVVAGRDSLGRALDYQSIAEATFAKSLCLTSSALPANRHLIAMLIETIGARETELLVRQWMTNLALPPRATWEQLLTDYSEGRCDVIVSRWSAVQGNPDVVEMSDEAVFFDVEGMGIGRHAQNPDGAERLIDWMLSTRVNAAHARARQVLPVTGDTPLELSGRFIGSGGFRQDEAAALAERARYR